MAGPFCLASPAQSLLGEQSTILKAKTSAASERETGIVAPTKGSEYAGKHVNALGNSPTYDPRTLQLGEFQVAPATRSVDHSQILVASLLLGPTQGDKE